MTGHEPTIEGGAVPVEARSCWCCRRYNVTNKATGDDGACDSCRKYCLITEPHDDGDPQ